MSASRVVVFLCFVPYYYQDCTTSPQTKKEECPTYQVVPFVLIKAGRFLDSHNGAIIAIFTAVLASSTIGLWIVTWLSGVRQSSDMEASIAVARQSADAAVRVAENAEKALRALEIPHVYPVNLDFTVLENALGVPEQATVAISLKNFGRSPAFLKETWIIAAVTQAGTGQTIYRSSRIPFMTDDVIGDKETFGPLDVQIAELVQYAHRIRDGAFRLNLLVHHRFDDAMENSFGRSTWYVWNPRRQRFVTGIQLWTEN